MLRFLRSRLTYANVVATVAMFSALSGGAYAAVRFPEAASAPDSSNSRP